MRTRVAASIWAVFMVLATLAQGAEPSGAAAEMEQLRTENEALRGMVKRLAKENAELKAELQRLKQALDKAGIDVAALPPASPVPDHPQEPSPDTKKDPNTVVAKAIQQYTTAIAAIDRADTTDIQKRKDWLDATRQLDAVLRSNRFIVTYVVGDVFFYQRTGSARIKPKSATIETSDPNVKLVMMQGLYNVRIACSEDETLQIHKDSILTVEGTAALNVDFSADLTQQPAVLEPIGSESVELDAAEFERRRGKEDFNRTIFSMKGCWPVGQLPGVGKDIYLVMGSSAVTKIDGVVRTRLFSAYKY